MDSLAGSSTARARARRLALFLAFLLAVQAQNLEYQVKAAFLLNFTRFISWPAPDSPSAPPPFPICILGEDPFGPALDQVVAGEAVEGRKIAVRRLAREAPGSCEILYISKEVKDVTEALHAAGPGTLTVGEGEDFIAQGGIIAFVIENRRVRFEVGQAAARKAGLNLSSRLLSVARAVR